METMSHFVTVIFDNSRPYYFSTTISDLSKDEIVVVETIRGLELGKIDKPSTPIEELSTNLELKPIIRRAAKEDLENHQSNIELAKKAYDYCLKVIENLGLDMRLLKAQYVLDRSKLAFVYASEERVDFRELLKDLAATFKCRIELRQIGARDRSKLVGGLGACGLPICCSQFLGDFDGITINMAKNQFLALNIQKISGQCGKLMCCLKYENDTYTELRKDLPKVNTRLMYNDEQYKITSINVLTNQVRLENQNSIIMLSIKEVQNLLKEQGYGTNNEQ